MPGDLLTAPLEDLLAAARERRRGDGLVTYSPKVFVPLTTLCRDVCGYCTFARPPRRGERAFLTEAEVLGRTMRVFEAAPPNLRVIWEGASVAFARATAGGGLSSTDIRDLMVGSTAALVGLSPRSMRCGAWCRLTPACAG